MKTICTTTYIDLKEAKAAGVTVDVDHRIATVKGPRNTLVRNFKHANLEFTWSMAATGFALTCGLRQTSSCRL